MAQTQIQKRKQGQTNKQFNERFGVTPWKFWTFIVHVFICC